MTLGFDKESLEHANSTNENPSHSATYMVCDIQCSQCLLKMMFIKAGTSGMEE